MSAEYSVEVCKELEAGFHRLSLHRPMRIARYEPGTELTCTARAVGHNAEASVKVSIDKFVGGGFAGQVYKVKVLDIQPATPELPGLEVGKLYAMKILVPPSGFSLLFRNVLYWIGFQGPFQLQVNPAAARAGAIWQKFIRRAAAIRFGDERSVVDIHATFVDEGLGSCGELSEWVDGRTWQLEVDDRLDLLTRWQDGEESAETQLGSPEYRAKRKFMADFVELLHEIGAPEFARQYEWATCKSQPNCLKRKDSGNDPAAGLVAVDFRAGLALLPFLPMSPGDFALIVRGIRRGSLVQFDRGSIPKLEAFVEAHPDDFADMRGALDELKTTEDIYRNSVPDITHNRTRLLYDRKLFSTMLSSAVTGWCVRNLIDEHSGQKLRRSTCSTLLFFIVGLIPFLGKVLRRAWGRPDWRRHYIEMLASWSYLERAFRGRMAEKLIAWHRSGRVSSDRAQALAQSAPRFLGHVPLSLLPAGLHRLLTDWPHAKDRLSYYMIRPIRLYFNAEAREQWLHDMLDEGRDKHMLSDEDSATIISQLSEPFIQKYLKSLAVHVCTLPVTQVVSVFLAITYVLMHPDMPRAQAWGRGIGIIALFQVTPISPGSLVRGLYVLYLVIRERNFKDYNIAVFLGFFKYVGYLAFPIQMTYHYPALARFMAAHWATEAVHVVPVFGERGALLEHWVFCLFYNWPLTIRRRMRKRAEMRKPIDSRYWHLSFCAVAAVALLALAEFLYLTNIGSLPQSKWWWLGVLLPVAGACGAATTLGCGGAELWKRVVSATACGILTAIAFTLATGLLFAPDLEIGPASLISTGIWRAFAFAILAAIGAVVAELRLPEPEIAV